jgi:hypothetical protein
MATCKDIARGKPTKDIRRLRRALPTEPVVLVIFNPKSARQHWMAELLSFGCFKEARFFIDNHTKLML